MEKTLHKAKECGIIYLIGSVGYSLIEILWRGFTHWTMAVTGGVCFLLLYQIDGRHETERLPAKCLRGACWITAIEFIVGCVVYLKLKWAVWDYSDLFGNLLGQVCPLYFALWFLLCVPVFRVARSIRNYFCRYLH